MKLGTENSDTLQQCQIHLPFGLIGLADLQHFELAPISGSEPFLSMQSVGDGDRIGFIVVEPQGVIPDYEIELSDEDADALQLHSAEEAMVLNIVTIHSSQPLYVTVNLIGPVIVNRNSMIGKQVIIKRSGRYSTHHKLIDERNSANAA